MVRDILGDAVVLFEVALPLPLLTRAVVSRPVGAGAGGAGIVGMGGVLPETAVWELSEGVSGTVFSL